MATQKNRKQITAVKRMLCVVEALTELGEAEVTELANYVELPTSTVYYYLDTLYQEGYVIKNGTTYLPGLAFFDIGERIREQRELYQVAKPKLQNLASETNEMCNLMIEENGLGYHVVRAESNEAIWVNPRAGDPGLLHSRALGKAILAYLPEERVNKIITEHGLLPETENTIVEKELLFEELASIREKGIAFDNEERMIGVRCVASPILDNNEQPLGSISITGPKNRIKNERFSEELPNQILEAASYIEINMNY